MCNLAVNLHWTAITSNSQCNKSQKRRATHRFLSSRNWFHACLCTAPARDSKHCASGSWSIFIETLNLLRGGCTADDAACTRARAANTRARSEQARATQHQNSACATAHFAQGKSPVHAQVRRTMDEIRRSRTHACMTARTHASVRARTHSRTPS